jgi:rhomboid family protein
MYRNRGSMGLGGIPGMTPMVQRIVVANSVIWLLQMVGGQIGFNFTRLGEVSVAGVVDGFRIWQPFTYMWLHATDNVLHLLFNMLFLWMIGPQLEMVWGSKRFFRFYMQCGVGAGFVILGWNALCSLWNPYAWYDTTVGASGAIYGVVTAFSLLWPDRTIMLLIPPIPIRAIWFVPLLLVMDTILGSRNVSVIGHLGGALVAAVLLRSELRSALNWRSLRFRWHRMRMRSRLRAVRRDEWEKRRNDDRRFH